MPLFLSLCFKTSDRNRAAFYQSLYDQKKYHLGGISIACLLAAIYGQEAVDMVAASAPEAGMQGHISKAVDKQVLFARLREYVL